MVLYSFRLGMRLGQIRGHTRVQTMHKIIEYKVGDEPQTTNEHELAPRTILKNAGYDPESHYLMLIRGHDKDSFKDRPDELIHLRPHMHFIPISCAPTPVS